MMAIVILITNIPVVVFGGVRGSVPDGYDSSRQVAYENVYKLMPLYHGKDIIENGNRLAVNHILNTAQIRVIFEDGQLKDYNVTYQSSVGNIANYSIDELGVIYSFDKYMIDRTSKAVTKLTNHIKSTNYSNYLGLLSGDTVDNRSLRDNYEELLIS